MGGSSKKPGNTLEVLPHHEGGWDVMLTRWRGSVQIYPKSWRTVS